MDMLYHTFEFFDDVTGQRLDKLMAREVRKLEMKFFRNVKVHDKVDGRTRLLQGHCDEVAGHQQGPPAESEPQRWAGRPGDQDGFSLGLICRHTVIGFPANVMLHVREQPGQAQSAQDHDVRKAFFDAKATWQVYMEIPVEDFELGDEGKVAGLNLSLCGTRDALQNWAKEHTTFLEECGFRAGLASPCNFNHSSRS